MLKSTRSFAQLVAAQKLAPRTPLVPGLSGWLLRCWQVQCRRAERPDRIVPYY